MTSTAAYGGLKTSRSNSPRSTKQRNRDPRDDARPVNPLHPDCLAPLERRAELCRLLALGLVRLKQRQSSELSDGTGESSLHKPPDRSGHATTERRRNA